jgi:hypothetical protein
MNLDTHPTIIAYKEEKEAPRVQIQELEANRKKKDALAAGADDTGLIDIARESMAAYREDLLKVLPETICVLCLVFRVNQLALKSTEHSVSWPVIPTTTESAWAGFKTGWNRLLPARTRVITAAG